MSSIFIFISTNIHAHAALVCGEACAPIYQFKHLKSWAHTFVASASGLCSFVSKSLIEIIIILFSYKCCWYINNFVPLTAHQAHITRRTQAASLCGLGLGLYCLLFWLTLCVCVCLLLQLLQHFTKLQIVHHPRTTNLPGIESRPYIAFGFALHRNDCTQLWKQKQ